MRIAISTQSLSNGHTGRGVGVYTVNLLAALKKNKTIEIVEFRDPYKIPESVDLVHFPFFDPFFLTLPLYMRMPFVVTVHDLIPFVFPEHFPTGIRGALKWQVQKWGVSKASRIITDSVSSKNDIEKFVSSLKNRVDVVYLAQPDSFNTAVSTDTAKDVIEKYSLPRRFAVYVGDVNWNKNIQGLLAAWHQLDVDGDLRTGEKLYLVGGAFLTPSVELQAVKDLIAHYHIESSVVFTGRVSDADLPTLLSLSTVYVFPSFYEGFGLPVLEAMASGTIVVTTNKGSLKEIAGPSILCNPSDFLDIANQMKEVFALDPKKREKLIQDGMTWAKKFNWTKVAEETIAVYNKAIGA